MTPPGSNTFSLNCPSQVFLSRSRATPSLLLLRTNSLELSLVALFSYPTSSPIANPVGSTFQINPEYDHSHHLHCCHLWQVGQTILTFLLHYPTSLLLGPQFLPSPPTVYFLHSTPKDPIKTWRRFSAQNLRLTPHFSQSKRWSSYNGHQGPQGTSSPPTPDWAPISFPLAYFDGGMWAPSSSEMC